LFARHRVPFFARETNSIAGSKSFAKVRTKPTVNPNRIAS
jgi:hypothetical protein